ncbi:hypothetical protein ACJX0J_016549 [Zea mays]
MALAILSVAVVVSSSIIDCMFVIVSEKESELCGLFNAIFTLTKLKITLQFVFLISCLFGVLEAAVMLEYTGIILIWHEHVIITLTSFRKETGGAGAQLAVACIYLKYTTIELKNNFNLTKFIINNPY